MRLAAIDVETTCLDPHRCSIVAAAMVAVEDDYVDLSTALYAVTGGRSSEQAALVHGIVSGEPHVAANTSLEELLVKAQEYLLITYGSHDAAFLAEEARRRGIEAAYCYIDVLSALLENPARRVEAARRGHYSLEDAVQELLGIKPPPRGLHDPLEDAVYTALVYLAARRRGVRAPKKCLESKRGRHRLVALLGALRGLRRGNRENTRAM